MVDPLGVLLAGPTAATTKVEEDVYGGLPGSAVGRSDSGHHRS
jgi:hypothetical protein